MSFWKTSYVHKSNFFIHQNKLCCECSKVFYLHNTAAVLLLADIIKSPKGALKNSRPQASRPRESNSIHWHGTQHWCFEKLQGGFKHSLNTLALFSMKCKAELSGAALPLNPSDSTLE